MVVLTGGDVDWTAHDAGAGDTPAVRTSYLHLIAADGSLQTTYR